jgi:GH24 family phage-related lysozyme (muramidase)
VSKRLRGASGPLATIYSFSGVRFNWQPQGDYIHDDISGRTCAAGGLGAWNVSLTITNNINPRNTGTLYIRVLVTRPGIPATGTLTGYSGPPNPGIHIGQAMPLTLTLLPGRRVRVERSLAGVTRSATVRASARKGTCACPTLAKGQRLTRSAGKAIVDFIRARERFRSRPYNDLGDTKGACTVGYGHVLHYSPCTGTEPAITKAEGEALFETDVSRAEAALAANVRVDLNQNQYDALLDLAFNAGIRGQKRAALRTAINSCNSAGLFAEMRKLVYSQGEKLQELVNRREYEIALFQK